MRSLISHPAGPLKGTARVPGDKSISHRALMMGAVAVGETVIHGLLEGEDIGATAGALSALGVRIARDGCGAWRVQGVGTGGLGEPARVLELGNAGTAARLLMGLLASHPVRAHLTGDASLVRRPMARVAEPLERMGARIVGRAGCRLPLAITGTDSPIPITYRLVVPSAQVKSAILLAALNAPGETTVIEPQPTRDHTERMLRHFEAEIAVEETEDSARAIRLRGYAELKGREVRVPADPSSAAFPLVGAALRAGSSVLLPDVSVNPSRFGLIETLHEMGATIECGAERLMGGEPVADIRVSASPLVGVDVPAERAPRMIDEYPALAIAAACAEGKSTLRGLGELRIKESNRLDAIARGLLACGARIETDGDDLVIHGSAAPPAGGVTIEAQLDHRIAMAFLTLGLVAREPIRVTDAAAITTSFPGFAETMNALGAAIATDASGP